MLNEDEDEAKFEVVLFAPSAPFHCNNRSLLITPFPLSTMKVLSLLTIAVVSSMEGITVSSFSTISPIAPKSSSSVKTQLHSDSVNSPDLDRRSVLSNLASSVLLASSIIPAAANAAAIADLPSVTRFVRFPVRLSTLFLCACSLNHCKHKTYFTTALNLT